MIVTIGALLASFIVPLAMFFFMKSAHKDDENYQKDCNTLLLKGSLLAPPVFLFSLAMNLLFAFVFKGNASPLLKALFKAFFLAAFSEEVMKYLVANKTIQNNKAKVSFLDVMAYTCIAAIGFVRRALVAQQQQMGKDKGVVMDGRDIGTVVFPDAELKVFVTASAEVRAQRRYDELKAKGMPADFDDILKNVQERDYIDSHREESPLRQAKDAILLDNSHMTIDEQKQWLLEQFKNATH